VLRLVQALAWGRDGQLFDAILQTRDTFPSGILLIPILGGVFVTGCYLLLRKRDQLQGTAAMLEALTVKKGRLSPLRALVESLASITAVGMGASVGREGPMIYSGSAIGSWLGVKLRLEDRHVRMLLACGAAGGIAAAYNVPIGASVFAMEVLLGTFALELFGPIIICSVISTIIARTLIGEQPTYLIPHGELILSEWEILTALVLGVSMGLVSVIFIRVFSGLGKLFGWLQPLQHVKPIVAMALLGATGYFAPEIFGNGYNTVNLVLNPTENGAPTLDLRPLLVLPILKILMTALCRAGGVPGGLFTPSLFIGALLGGAFGMGVHALLPGGSAATPGAYALLGMGAILSGTLHAPITAVLIIFEMTHKNDYGIILPLMSACISSALVSYFLQGGSLYTEPLKRIGIVLPSALAPAWLHQPTIRSVVRPTGATVSPAERFEKVTEIFLKAPEGENQLYVTNKEGKFLGTISLHEIKRFFRETEHLDSVIAADIANSSGPSVCAEDPVSHAIELLAESDAEFLPVLDDPASRKLIGTVSKRNLLAAYRETNMARQTEQKDDS
jgi:CIC family chloride channel protein